MVVCLAKEHPFESSTITEGSRYFLVGAVIVTFLVGIAFEDFTYFFFFYLIWFFENVFRFALLVVISSKKSYNKLDIKILGGIIKWL